MSEETYELEYKGKRYLWYGSGWSDARTHIAPPNNIKQFLNKQLEDLLIKKDDTPRDSQTLMQLAKVARNVGQSRRAESLVARVLKKERGHRGALAIHSSILRERGKAKQALEVTEAYRQLDYPPLINSRAAALCDLGRWEEAKIEVGRALSIGTDKEASFMVVSRIKATRPDLYEKGLGYLRS